METLDYSIRALAWIGIVAFSALGLGVFTVVTLLIWERLIKAHLTARKLWKLTLLSMAMSRHKDKTEWSWAVVATHLEAAFEVNPELEKKVIAWMLDRIEAARKE